MSESFTRFDAAKYLKTPFEMDAYLDACFEEDAGDGLLIRTALNDIARAQGMTQVARDAGLGEKVCTKPSPALAIPSSRLS